MQNKKTARVTRLRMGLMALLLLGVAATADAQRWAVKTNALYLATATPNLTAEYRLSDKWSVNASVGYNPFTYNKAENRKLKHVLVQPEARYWFCSVYAGHFIGTHLIYSHYNASHIKVPFGLWSGLNENRYQGDLGAIGVLYGYNWMLGNRLSLEAAVGAGVGITKYDKFDCAVCGTKKGTEKKVVVMPTKVALSLVYYLK